MSEFMRLWQDIRKSCRENDICKTCKYKDFSKEICDLEHVTIFDIDRILKMFTEDGEMNEH